VAKAGAGLIGLQKNLEAASSHGRRDSPRLTPRRRNGIYGRGALVGMAIAAVVSLAAVARPEAPGEEFSAVAPDFARVHFRRSLQSRFFE